MENQEYYNKEFTCRDSSITRGELESLPFPFCTDDVGDETMQQIIEMTDTQTRMWEKLSENDMIDFKDEHISNSWWEELEKAVLHFKIPYYEDLTKAIEIKNIKTYRTNESKILCQSLFCR